MVEGLMSMKVGFAVGRRVSGKDGERGGTGLARCR
jgi:hypothetical protein